MTELNKIVNTPYGPMIEITIEYKTKTNEIVKIKSYIKPSDLKEID